LALLFAIDLRNTDMKSILAVFIVWALSMSVVEVVADDGLVVLPTDCRLTTPRARQALIVQRTGDGEAREQVTEGLAWSSSRPDVATVTDGVVTPVGNGETEVRVTIGDRTATAKVVVAGLERPSEWSFRNDILPAFAKLGCNAGACHGALAGKGGFRLSLLGYDADADHYQIVKQDSGRRVEFSDPGRSLILAKPSGAIPHKGGVKFDTDGEVYRMIADWVADGAAPPRADDARVERLRVWPERSVHRVGERQRIIVQAASSDGGVADVSRWVRWSSTNEAVCGVDENGVVTANGPGEGAIVAWYASQIAIARVTVPYNASDPTAHRVASLDKRPPRNVIDEHINGQLARLNLPTSAACGDAEFLRRASITTIGRLPTVEESRAFLADANVSKRDALIDRLLGSPEYVDYWTYKWSDVLMLNGTLLRPQALKAYYGQVHKHVEMNTPWDQFVRSIVTATGDSVEDGLTNFYALHQSPEEMVESTSQAFLGLSIGCAKCHNHPLEKWTNDQYYAAANLFARVKAKGWGGEPRNGDGLRTLFVATSGDLVQPRTGRPQPPTPLDGAPLAIDDPGDRRVPFANWLTSPENPYFSRSIANRVWANFFGVGLVENVDDLRMSNPASDEALLSGISKIVIEAKFDLKVLMKAILQSNAFQRSSAALDGNRDETRFYSRYYPKRMMAEVLHDAIVQVTGVPTKFEWVEFPGNDRQKTDFYPAGTRAIQLYDSSVQNYFLQAFGRNPRRIVCECERTDQPTLVQVLHISNGDTLNDKLKATGNRVGTLLRLRGAGMSDASLLDEAYLSCLARYPTSKERASLLEVLPKVGDAEERAVIEDIFWGLMSGREFLFNH
jgi:hypothetical protein